MGASWSEGNAYEERVERAAVHVIFASEVLDAIRLQVRDFLEERIADDPFASDDEVLAAAHKFMVDVSARVNLDALVALETKGSA